MAYGPVPGLILPRKRLGALDTAAAPVVWGAIIPMFEPAAFAIASSRDLAAVSDVSFHSRYHLFKAGAFSIVAGVLLSSIAVTQLWRSERGSGSRFLLR